MKKLLAALVAGLFAGFAYTAMAADEVKTGGPTDKPGRAAEQSKDVKAGGAIDKPGRAAEEKKEGEQKAPAKKKKKKEGEQKAPAK